MYVYSLSRHSQTIFQIDCLHWLRRYQCLRVLVAPILTNVSCCGFFIWDILASVRVCVLYDINFHIPGDLQDWASFHVLSTILDVELNLSCLLVPLLLFIIK